MLFYYDEVWKCFNLVPVREECRDLANFHFDRSFYDTFPPFEYLRYDDSGFQIKIPESLIPEFTRIGLEADKSYDIPSVIMPFDLNEEEVDSLFYSLRDAIAV